MSDSSKTPSKANLKTKDSSQNPNPSSEEKSSSSRIIKATRQASSQKLLGNVEILAYTKHGATTLISVAASQKLDAGDILKTSVWILNGKEFTVVERHQQAMKIPGAWYEVRVVKN